MSEQAPSQAKRRRFSGPELTELLTEVVAEHGSTAAIAQVNRIRSGGVGGFFCREEFEVIVNEAPAAHADDSERIVAEGRIGRETAADVGPAERLTVNSDRGTIDGGDEAFRALLERRLAETSLDDESFAPLPPRPASGGRHLAGSSVDANGEAPTVLLHEPPPTSAVDAATTDRHGQTPSFWIHLHRTRRELEATRPPMARVTAVVGPLAPTMSVIRGLQCSQRLSSDDVVVLSDRAEIISEPSWELVRTSDEMVAAAQRRPAAPVLLVVDVAMDLPDWLDPLLERLRRFELDLVRYAVTGSPGERELLRFRDHANQPYVVDLLSKVPPGRLLRMMDRGHPIASVAGVELNAEMLMALRAEVSRARRS